MSDPSSSLAAKVKPVVQGVLFGNVTLKDILDGVVLESSDLDSLLSADIHDAEVRPTVTLMRACQKRK